MVKKRIYHFFYLNQSLLYLKSISAYVKCYPPAKLSS